MDFVGQSRDAVGEARHVGHNMAIDATRHLRPAIVDYQSSLALAHSKAVLARISGVLTVDVVVAGIKQAGRLQLLGGQEKLILGDIAVVHVPRVPA